MTRFARSSLLTLAALLVAALLPAGVRGWVAAAALLAWQAGLALGVACIRLAWFGPVTCEGPPGAGRIALTFDDGPDPRVTPALLDLLAALEVKATFFCVGERVAAQPGLARRIVAEGHLIGNHSHRHAWWTNFLLAAGYRRELGAAQAAIESATGVRPRLFRPPMGLTNPHLHAGLRAAGLSMVGWSVRSLDRNARDPQAVVDRILHATRDGGIVLLHDGGVQCEPLLAIVRGAVAELRARGLTPVRLDELGR